MIRTRNPDALRSSGRIASGLRCLPSSITGGSTPSDVTISLLPVPTKDLIHIVISSIRGWPGNDQKPFIDPRQIADTLPLAEPQSMQFRIRRGAVEECAERSRQDHAALVVVDLGRPAKPGEQPAIADRQPLDGESVLVKPFVHETVQHRNPPQSVRATCAKR